METELAEWPTEYNRKPRPRNPNRRPHREKLQSQPFIAWDGEGYSDDNGKHHYWLFGNSDGESVQGKELTYKQCFPLLLQPRDGINVIFGGDYDVIMMTKGMPLVVRERLLKGLPVRYQGYRMVWFRRKYMLLKDIRTGRSTVLYDVHSFFQCSFVKACRQYLGESPELDAIHGMKLQRDSFAANDPAVIDYWKLELEYLVRLMDELRSLLSAVDIKPKGWYGPGAVASALMALHGMGQYYRHDIPQTLVDIAETAYYGGRFEQFKVGALNSVYEYDIRSAYPKGITMLPDFSVARWKHLDFPGKTYPERINPYGLYCVSWDIEYTPQQIGPLPWRDWQGRIFFPLKGHYSWYWGIEIIESLTKSFPQSMYEIHEAWEPEIRRPMARPFLWVEQMYEDRARMKAEGNPAQMALKLGLNSLYGKLAQSTGAKQDRDTGEWTKPKWHNVLWAGWVTAYTRAKIFSGIRKCRHSLVAIETDAVFVTEEIDQHITVGEALGEWERTDIQRILYVNSGVYYALDRGVWRLKTRGVEVDKSRSADHWLEIFAKLPKQSLELELKLRRFGTDLRQPERYGNWFDYTTHTTMPGAFSKRVHRSELCVTCLTDPDKSYADWHHYLVVPQPLIDSDWQSSKPYKFPWREDSKYEWQTALLSEAIETPEELIWQ